MISKVGVAVACLSCASAFGGQGQSHSSSGFDLTTATVSSIWAAISDGSETCESITTGFLARIDAYNPTLGAVLLVDREGALAAARGLDAKAAGGATKAGPLHCAPLLVKDNIDVMGLATTNGLDAFAGQVPQVDAETVRLAKEAGAVVLGKANMSPLADKEAWGHSQTGGMARNPFSTDYTTYGSSGGNGAAGAAMLTVLGFGTETGVSVNLPSSAGNIVGLRAPVEYLSQEGAFPNNKFEDVVGPMAKRVEDVAALYNAMRQPGAPEVPEAALTRDGLAGMKVGVFDMMLQDFDFGPLSYSLEPSIRAQFEKLLANVEALGAEVVHKEVDVNEAMMAVGALMGHGFPCVAAWREHYLGNEERFPADLDGAFHSVQEIVDANELPPFYQGIFEEQLAAAEQCDPSGAGFLELREDFNAKVSDPLLEGVSVTIWPTMPEYPQKLGPDHAAMQWDSETMPPINMILAGPWSGYATITIPMGWSEPTADSPQGLPIGVIMMAKPEHLTDLFTAAYAYQQHFDVQRHPAAFPAL